MGILKVTAYSYFICWVVSAWWSCLSLKLFLILGFCDLCLFHCVNFWASHCLYRLLRVWSIRKIPTEVNTQIHCLLLLKEQSCSWTELITGSYPGRSMSVLHYNLFFHLMIRLPFETFALMKAALLFVEPLCIAQHALCLKSENKSEISLKLCLQYMESFQIA